MRKDTNKPLKRLFEFVGSDGKYGFSTGHILSEQEVIQLFNRINEGEDFNLIEFSNEFKEIKIKIL